jgi:hypothetical protein
MINEILTIGNIICLIGTLLQIFAIYKNREILNGYSPVGSFLTFVSIVFFQYGFYLLDNLIGILFAVPTIIFWLMAFIYSSKRKLRK